MGAFSSIPPTEGMEVQRPLVISKFGQSAGGSAGCLCAKNTSRGLGWRPLIQSRQDGEARGGRASGSLAKHLQVFPKSLSLSLTPTPTATCPRDLGAFAC